MKPKIENNKKEYLRLNISETRPIKGGPIKKPRKAMVEIKVKEIPVFTVLCLPATPKTVGTLHEPPRPTTIKAIVHTTTFG